MTPSTRGYLYGIAAYGLWGLFPLYWRALDVAGPVEVLAHRVAWSMITMGLLLVVVRRVRAFRAILASPRTAGLLLVAAVTIAINWGVFILGVNTGHVLEVSLGYFINPLVTVLMGVLVLGERLRPWQWAAMAVAGLAVVVLSIDYGAPPWIALILALSFGTYGLSKKKADVDAVESLTFETAVLAPVALGYLVWLGGTGDGVFGADLSTGLLLASTGLVTAIPLLLFGAAAVRIPMTSLGLLQYLAPILHFVLGLAVFGEHMSGLRWVGFALVWTALAVFTVEALGHRRHQLRLAAEASAV